MAFEGRLHSQRGCKCVDIKALRKAVGSYNSILCAVKD
jgi:hypothetical protein